MADPTKNGTTLATRDAAGKFIEGNSGGPGNPWAKLSHGFKVALAQSATPERQHELIDILWSMATTPNDDDSKSTAQRWAIEQILNRCLGKPKETVEIEGDSAQTVAEFFRLAAMRLDARGRDG